MPIQTEFDFPPFFPYLRMGTINSLNSLLEAILEDPNINKFGAVLRMSAPVDNDVFKPDDDFAVVPFAEFDEIDPATEDAHGNAFGSGYKRCAIGWNGNSGIAPFGAYMICPTQLPAGYTLRATTAVELQECSPWRKENLTETWGNPIITTTASVGTGEIVATNIVFAGIGIAVWETGIQQDWNKFTVNVSGTNTSVAILEITIADGEVTNVDILDPGEDYGADREVIIESGAVRPYRLRTIANEWPVKYNMPMPKTGGLNQADFIYHVGVGIGEDDQTPWSGGTQPPYKDMETDDLFHYSRAAGSSGYRSARLIAETWEDFGATYDWDGGAEEWFESLTDPPCYYPTHRCRG